MKSTPIIILLLTSLLTLLSLAFWKSQEQQKLYEKEIKQLNDQLIKLTSEEISKEIYSLKTNPLSLKGVDDSLLQCLKWLREELHEEQTFSLVHFQDYQHYIYNTLLPVSGFRTKGQVDASLIKMSFDTTWTDNKVLNQSKKINNIRELLRYITLGMWGGSAFVPYRFFFLQEEENVFYEKDTMELPFLSFANYQCRIDKYSILPAPNISVQKEDYKYNLKLVTGKYKEGILWKKVQLRIRDNEENTIDTSFILIPYQLKKRGK